MKKQERMVSQKPCEESVSKIMERQLSKLIKGLTAGIKVACSTSKQNGQRGKGHTVPEVVLDHLVRHCQRLM